MFPHLQLKYQHTSASIIWEIAMEIAIPKSKPLMHEIAIPKSKPLSPF